MNRHADPVKQEHSRIVGVSRREAMHMGAGALLGAAPGRVVALVRVLLLAPLVIGLGIWYARSKRKRQIAHVTRFGKLTTLFPPFILGAFDLFRQKHDALPLGAQFGVQGVTFFFLALPFLQLAGSLRSFAEQLVRLPGTGQFVEAPPVPEHALC